MSEPETLLAIIKRAAKEEVLSSTEFKSAVAEEVRKQLDVLHLQKDYYTPEEYASIKKIKKQTVYKLCREKHLNHERVGNSIRIFEVR